MTLSLNFYVILFSTFTMQEHYCVVFLYIKILFRQSIFCTTGYNVSICLHVIDIPTLALFALLRIKML